MSLASNKSDVDTQNAVVGTKTMAALKQAKTGAERVSIFGHKIAGLSDQLTELNASQEQEGQDRFERLQSKIKGLEDRLSAAQNIGSKKFGEVKEMIMTFQDEIEREHAKREEDFRAKDAEIRKFDKALKSSLEREQVSLRQIETRTLNHFEHKVGNFRDEMNRGFRNSTTNTGNLRRYLEVDVPKLYAALREETSARESMEKQMLARAMDEVQELQTSIVEEKKARQETEEVLLRMMEDAVEKMQSEIAAERRERKATEQQMAQLLRDTCLKLKNSSP